MSSAKITTYIPELFTNFWYNCLIMIGVLAAIYAACLGLLIWLTNQEYIPKISEEGSEKLWALILAPIFFVIYLFFYFFKKDES